MLSLAEIKKFYPEYLHHSGDFLIREYLQYKILEKIYESEYAYKLVFLGGTCLRIKYGNQRFSEDLDFDNINLNADEFTEVSALVEKELALEGYETEIKVIHKTAFHLHIRFPGLLYQEGLSGHKEQKILIQLDTEPQHYEYQPDNYLINKFDVFTEINTVPLATILSQKFFAVLNRIRNKGRDFYDIAFILSMQTEPDWKYLKQKTGIDNKSDLKQSLIDHCNHIDMEEMAKDVEPFLFNAKEAKRVSMFPQLIDQTY